MKSLTIIGLLITVSIATTQGFLDSCQAGIAICGIESGLMNYLTNHTDGIQHETWKDREMMFRLEKSKLQGFCRIFDSYKTCLENDMLDNCNADVEAIITGFNNGITYICKGSFDEYMNYHECIQHTLDTTEARECLHRSINNVKADKNVKDICSDVIAGQSCSFEAVKDRCGYHSAIFFKNFLSEVDKPIFNHWGCSVDEKKEYEQFQDDGEYEEIYEEKECGFPSWLIVAMVLAGMLTFLGTCCSIRYCLRKVSTARTRNTLTFVARNSELPPPYPASDLPVVISDKKQLMPM